MKAEIRGTVAQIAELTMNAGDSIWATRGSIVSYSSHIDWTMKIPGGFSGGAKRILSGEGMALLRIEASKSDQRIVLGANAPGHIAEWDLEKDGPVLTTRGAFLAAWGESIDISVAVARRVGASLFGGAGLVLQKVSGAGSVLVHGRGDFKRIDLKEGENIFVSTGNLAAFSSGVDYDIQSVGSVRKTLFGKEGFFMTRLAGPGTVLLQTLKKQPSSSSS